MLSAGCRSSANRYAAAPEVRLSQEVEQWDIDEGIQDCMAFFALLLRAFPQATLFCVEGTGITKDVRAFYETHLAGVPSPAPKQTLFPTPIRYACDFTAAFIAGLTDLASRHAAPELCDHLSIYAGDLCLLAWHDAFANAILLDASLPESTVKALAVPFGVPYGRVRR
jgi:hypothetical protein